MYISDLENLVWMSRVAGGRLDYVQAGGGNTSVKFDDGYMAIKASGYLLKEMTLNSGFVAVNGAQMKNYYNEEHDAGLDCNKDSMEKAIASIKQVNGEKQARPSVEVGFHSVLQKYVLHLHPVYANVLLCAKDWEQKCRSIFENSDLNCVYIPYTMPGYGLTKLILDAIEEYEKTTGVFPQVIFMQNHGVITTAPTSIEAYELMVKANDLIIDALNLSIPPQVAVEEEAEGCVSRNEWLINALSDEKIVHACKYEALFPDQLVYLCNDIALSDNSDGKIVISNGKILYRAGYNQAVSLEESLIATVYVLKSIKELGLQANPLSEEDCANILGWDGEKYRKSLMENR